MVSATKEISSLYRKQPNVHCPTFAKLHSSPFNKFSSRKKCLKVDNKYGVTYIVKHIQKMYTYCNQATNLKISNKLQETFVALLALLKTTVFIDMQYIKI